MVSDLDRTLARIEAAIRGMNTDGEAKRTLWTCEDGWRVGYTTTKVVGGPHHSQFSMMAYKPGPDGAVRVKWVAYKTRKEAKFAATMAFYDHSPKRAKRDRWNGLDYGH